MIKLIIFDLDGVLIESKDWHYAALNSALEKIDSKYCIPYEEHLTKYDGLNTTKKLELLSIEKLLPKKYFNQVWEDKQKATIKIIKNLDTDYNLVNIFYDLKVNQNYRSASVTGNVADTVVVRDSSANINATTFTGDLVGNASSATVLATPRNINNVSFDGSQNITITASTTNSLLPGTDITGQSFNGSSQITWGVDSASTNTASKIVKRDSSGNFSAGRITASLVGNVLSSATGNTVVNTTTTIANFTGSLTGNADTATKLATIRTINGVNFDGTQSITITDSTKVSKAGDTMSGFLTLSANLSLSIK